MAVVEVRTLSGAGKIFAEMCSKIMSTSLSFEMRQERCWMLVGVLSSRVHATIFGCASSKDRAFTLNELAAMETVRFTLPSFAQAKAAPTETRSQTCHHLVLMFQNDILR